MLTTMHFQYVRKIHFRMLEIYVNIVQEISISYSSENNNMCTDQKFILKFYGHRFFSKLNLSPFYGTSN